MSVIARVPVTARVGIALILIGIALFGGRAWWDATRTWVPLDMRLPLSQGRLRTPEFKINVESAYEMYIEVELGDNSSGALSCSWSLSTGGRAVANSSSGDYRFSARKGVYVLDLDVWLDGSRLNASALHLVVREAGGERDNANDVGVHTFLLSLFLAGAGLYLTVRSARTWRREKLAALVRSWSLTQPGPQPRNLRTDREPPALPPAQTGFRPSASACVGAVLVLAGMAGYAPLQYWIATRNTVPVDVPVSLAAGHVRTGPFRINLGGNYTISVETDSNRPYASCGHSSLLETRWVAHRDGQPVDGSEIPLVVNCSGSAGR